MDAGQPHLNGFAGAGKENRSADAGDSAAGAKLAGEYGRPGPVRTFQDLLKTPYDEDLFEYYATAQLAMIDSSSGKISSVGAPGIFRSIDVAPDGNHILVGRIHRPFSYLYPDFAFPRDVEVGTRKGS